MHPLDTKSDALLEKKNPSGPCSPGSNMWCLLDLQGKAGQETLSQVFCSGERHAERSKQGKEVALAPGLSQEAHVVAQTSLASFPQRTPTNNASNCFQLTSPSPFPFRCRLRWGNAGASAGAETAEKGSGCCFLSSSPSLNPLWHSHSPEVWWRPAGYNSWWFSLNNLSRGQP